MSKLSEAEMTKVMQRFEALDALRSCKGASDGEKRNATMAMESLLHRHGLDMGDVAAHRGGAHIGSPFFIGNDAPHVQRFKLAMLDIISTAHYCKVMRTKDGTGSILFGSRDRVRQATDLYSFLQGSMALAADDGWNRQTLRHNQVEGDWKHSFCEGGLVAIKRRLQDWVREQVEEGEITEEEIEQNKADLNDFMKNFFSDERMKENFNELLRQYQEECAKAQAAMKMEQDKAAPDYNALGYAAGMRWGEAVSLQAEIVAA